MQLRRYFVNKDLQTVDEQQIQAVARVERAIAGWRAKCVQDKPLAARLATRAPRAAELSPEMFTPHGDLPASLREAPLSPLLLDLRRVATQSVGASSISEFLTGSQPLEDTLRDMVSTNIHLHCWIEADMLCRSLRTREDTKSAAATETATDSLRKARADLGKLRRLLSVLNHGDELERAIAQHGGLEACPVTQVAESVYANLLEGMLSWRRRTLMGAGTGFQINNFELAAHITRGTLAGQCTPFVAVTAALERLDQRATAVAKEMQSYVRGVPLHFMPVSLRCCDVIALLLPKGSPLAEWLVSLQSELDRALIGGQSEGLPGYLLARPVEQTVPVFPPEPEIGSQSLGGLLSRIDPDAEVIISRVIERSSTLLSQLLLSCRDRLRAGERELLEVMSTDRIADQVLLSLLMLSAIAALAEYLATRLTEGAIRYEPRLAPSAEQEALEASRVDIKRLADEQSDLVYDSKRRGLEAERARLTKLRDEAKSETDRTQYSALVGDCEQRLHELDTRRKVLKADLEAKLAAVTKKEADLKAQRSTDLRMIKERTAKQLRGITATKDAVLSDVHAAVFGAGALPAWP